MRTPTVGWLACSLLLGCAEYPPPETTFGVLGGDSTSDGEVALGDVHARLDLDAPGAAVGDLVGWNVGPGSYYGPEGDPLHPEWRTPVRVAAVQALAEVQPGHGRAPLMRFAGQEIDGVEGGDGYHFYRHVEPGHAPAADDRMASFEYMALIDEVGAAPIVTLNFGSGSASEAAAYVTHLNGTDPDDVNVAARVHWGVDAPHDQRRFEIGASPYAPSTTGYLDSGTFSYANPDATHGGDPAWHGRPSASAADYAARALEYVAAVQAVEPEARFYIPLSPASMTAWGGVEAATQALAPLWSDPAVAGAVIQHYLLDDAAAVAIDDPNYLLFAVAGTEVFRDGFARARAALDAARPGLELVVSEYHLAGAASRDTFVRGMEAVVGLGVADMLIFYAQTGVDAACQQLTLEFDTLDDADRHPLIEPWYSPFRPGTGTSALAMASYHTTRLFAEHLLERTAPLEFSRQAHEQMFLKTDAIEVPLVHAAAFVDEGATVGSVVVLHRDLYDTHTLTLDLPEGWKVTAGEQWAPRRAYHNTRYQPVAVEPIAWVQGGARVEVTLPRSSVVALRFAAG